jgi:hypothetical protein
MKTRTLAFSADPRKPILLGFIYHLRVWLPNDLDSHARNFNMHVFHTHILHAKFIYKFLPVLN